jgi:very-short-patch-repair endonuclease
MSYVKIPRQPREPHCPVCGYTAKDAAIHLDHHLCKGKIPASQAKPKIPKAKSEPEEAFAIAWKALNGPAPEREFEFNPMRKWRFDFCWPDVQIAVEIEGGIYEGDHRGRHMRQLGFTDDCVKYADAALRGWRVVRLTPPMIQPELLKEIMAAVRRVRHELGRY